MVAQKETRRASFDMEVATGQLKRWCIGGVLRWQK
jgi:hypothetical protein